MPLNINIQQILLHLLNFTILAGGLYILLYGPVKKFMDAREEHYRKLDDEAEEKLNAAKAAEAEYAEKIALAKKEIAALRAESDKKAQAAADEKIEAAVKESREIIKKARESAEYEKSKIIADANREIESLVSEAVDKMIATKTGDSIEDFLDSVREVNEDDRP